MKEPKIMTIDIPEDVTHVEVDGVRFRRDYFKTFAEGKEQQGFVMFVKADPNAKGFFLVEINREMENIFEAQLYLSRKMKSILEIATDKYGKDDPDDIQI